jgi:hypothetical protein
MAIEHVLYVAAAKDLGEIAAAVVADGQQGGQISTDANVEALTGEGMISCAGSWLRVYAIRQGPDLPPHPVRAELGIPVDTGIVFRVDPSHDSGAQLDEMLEMSLHMLQRIPADAVLVYELETIVLLRRENQLFLGRDDTFWTPERLALITDTYEWIPKRFPGS